MSKRQTIFPVFFTVSLLLCLLALPAAAKSEAWLIDVRGAIGPALAHHVQQGLTEAQTAGAELVILRMDTPGGLDSAMRDMIRAELASDIPVVVYVAPGGARAASAGTYILYAAHIAAMVPGTNLGAATPIQIGMPGLPTGTPDQEGHKRGADAPSPGTAMEHKIVNDAVAYIQSLAQLRGRNSQWAEKAVREGASISAEDALKLGVIDLVAPSLEALLMRLDGRQVDTGNGLRELHSRDLSVHVYEMSWRNEFLALVTDPTVAYILMLVGIYGLLIEFYHPGIAVPGVIGGVCLLLAMYAFQVLPVSYAGLALILLGIGLMAAEAFAPSFGVLGMGGIVSFVVGSVMLMDRSVPGYQIALPVIAGFSAVSVLLLVFALGMVLKSRRRAVVSGVQHLLGACAVVETVQSGVARARLDGELWELACEEPVRPGDTVKVDAIDGLTLQVSKTTGDISDV